MQYKKLYDLIGMNGMCLSYIHITNTISNANNILINGLLFKDFKKSTSALNGNNLSDLIEKRKYLGNYIIILQTGRNIGEYYTFCETTFNNIGEQFFIFPSKFIKGYYDKLNDKIIINSHFNN